MGMHSYMEGMPFWLSRPIIFGIHVEFTVCVPHKNDPKNTTSANFHILTSFSVVLGRKLMQKATQLLSCLVPFVSIKAGNPRRPFWSRTKVTSQTSGCFLNIPATLARQGKGKKIKSNMSVSYSRYAMDKRTIIFIYIYIYIKIDI